MNKAFTKESAAEGDEPDHAAEEAELAQFVGVRNYITPAASSASRTSGGFCSPGSGGR
jgi:hypothetical protein